MTTMLPPATQTPPSVGLFDLIAWVETKANCRSIRFEPAVFAAISTARSPLEKAIIDNIQNRCMCSWGTALMIYSTSWGAVQIMGFNLWTLSINYHAGFMDFLESEQAQRDAFVKFIAATPSLKGATVDFLASSKTSRMNFALAYNGGADYVGAIEDALNHFNIPFTN